MIPPILLTCCPTGERSILCRNALDEILPARQASLLGCTIGVDLLRRSIGSVLLRCMVGCRLSRARRGRRKNGAQSLPPGHTLTPNKCISVDNTCSKEGVKTIPRHGALLRAIRREIIVLFHGEYQMTSLFHLPVYTITFRPLTASKKPAFIFRSVQRRATNSSQSTS